MVFVVKIVLGAVRNAVPLSGIFHYCADLPSQMCTTCGKLFKLRAELRTHVRITHAQRSYVCDLCQRAFKNRPALRRHLMTYHSKERQFECDRELLLFQTVSTLAILVQ